MEKLKILILDDEEIIQEGITEFLQRKNFEVYNALTPSQGFEHLKKQSMDIILLDIRLPEMNGIKVLEIVKKEYPDIEVIMITGHGDTETIIKAMLLGAIDYFYKPIDLIDIENAIRKTTRYKNLENQLAQYKDAYSLLSQELMKQIGDQVIGTSPPMQKTIELTKKASVADQTSVLIAGPSGSGKELIAKMIHFYSNRKDQIFHTINCTAIPESLAESEFFGHTSGAFTGATETKRGCFEIANNGTLFIDEIGDMPLTIQSKLLRVLETRKVKKLGSNHETPVDIRIITATNQNLKKMIDKGNFRLDLYHRLNTIEIHLPSLKERKEDIPLLLDYFTQFFSTKLKKHVTTISKDVVTLLSNYDFPGNIRELKNLVERAVILCDNNQLKLNHFPFAEILNQNKKPEKEYEINQEKQKIIKTLDQQKYNIKKTAEVLGISRYSLYRKLKKHNIQY
ncbi:MAG: sigma-54 dependent transcriptional regulator [Spirochaetes bacterium]|nr:sigma-54 dependent transcriptional regulator [Spirochaetota bacterium]